MSTTLQSCLDLTKPFSDANWKDQILLGLIGEYGEFLESQREHFNATFANQEKTLFYSNMKKEATDILVYLTLYVKHVGCKWGVDDSIGLNTLQKKLSSLIKVTAANEMMMSICRLVEYEKKVGRGSKEGTVEERTNLVKSIVEYLLYYTGTYRFELEEEFLRVTLDNQERYKKGHYGKVTV